LKELLTLKIHYLSKL